MWLKYQSTQKFRNIARLLKTSKEVKSDCQQTNYGILEARKTSYVQHKAINTFSRQKNIRSLTNLLQITALSS